MHKLVIAILLTTTIIFGGLYINQGIKVKNIEVEKPVDVAVQTEVKSLQNKLKALESENEKLKIQLKTLDAARAELVKNNQNTKTANVTQPVATVDNNTSPFVQMLQDPKMIEAMKQRRDRMVLERYDYLLTKLNLNEDQKTKLIELLGERSSAAMAAGMKTRMTESEEERELANKERDRLFAEADAKISDLLGAQYGTYADFKEKEREYHSVESFNSRLEKSPLNDNQKDQLATIMSQTNTAFKFSNEKVNESRWGVYYLNDEERAAHVKEMEVRDEMILKDSASFLSADQLEELRKQQSNDRERISKGRRGFGEGRDRGFRERF